MPQAISRRSGPPFWVWALAFMVVGLIFSLAYPSNPVYPISYTNFMEQVEGDNIEKVSVERKTTALFIRGELRDTAAIGELEVVRFTANIPYERGEYVFEKLEENGVAIQVLKGGNYGWIIQLLFWLIMLFLIFFLIRRMQGGAGGSSGGVNPFGGYGKAKATSVIPNVTFEDVAGCDEAKEELQELISFLKSPEKYQRLGGRIPRGYLLMGPPGSGKTLMARAVAGEAERPFFTMSGSDFVEMFVGVGASRVRDLFKQARENAPCIVFIDEIDAVGKKRGASVSSHDEREQTLNQLLTEMDGFNSDDRVILIGATNRPDVLDSALLRPGRFDRQVTVDAPDMEGRKAIMRLHACDKKLHPDVNIDETAKKTPTGFTGADIANVLNEAAIFAAREDSEHIHDHHIIAAIQRVLMGPERKSRVLDEGEKRIIAHHEAGHALASVLLEHADKPHQATIVPRGMSGGAVWSAPEYERMLQSRIGLEHRLIVLMAGRAAEMRLLGHDGVTTGAASDIEQASNVARRMITLAGMSEALGPVQYAEMQNSFLEESMGAKPYSDETSRMIDDEVRAICKNALNKAVELLDAHEAAHIRLVDALLAKETLDGAEIRAAVYADAQE